VQLLINVDLLQITLAVSRVLQAKMQAAIIADLARPAGFIGFVIATIILVPAVPMTAIVKGYAGFVVTMQKSRCSLVDKIPSDDQRRKPARGRFSPRNPPSQGLRRTGREQARFLQFA
jgi:hypothetical protein